MVNANKHVLINCLTEILSAKRNTLALNLVKNFPQGPSYLFRSSAGNSDQISFLKVFVSDEKVSLFAHNCCA